MLQDDREVRLEMTLNLGRPGALFNDLGEKHFLRDLKSAFAIFWKVPGSFVKRWRKRVTLACEDFSGFLIASEDRKRRQVRPTAGSRIPWLQAAGDFVPEF